MMIKVITQTEEKSNFINKKYDSLIILEFNLDSLPKFLRLSREELVESQRMGMSLLNISKECGRSEEKLRKYISYSLRKEFKNRAYLMQINTNALIEKIICDNKFRGWVVV